MKSDRRNAGFTLVELLIASAILLVLMVAVSQAFLTQQRTHVVIDQVTEAQQNLRAVSELIERDLRRSGYMVPPHAAVCARRTQDQVARRAGRRHRKIGLVLIGV